MGVDSIIFVVFFLVSLGIYYSCSEKIRQYVLLALSLVFAASYDMRSIVLMAGTAAVIWAVGLRMQAPGAPDWTPKDIKRRNRRWLILANCILIGNLALLKYLLPTALPLFFPAAAARLLVPLGISYYTLQAVSYLVDIHWGRIQAEKHYGRLLLFICYFPHILQGPINRYGDFSGQAFEKKHDFNIRNLKNGVQLMLWGVFKVYVVSGRIASHTTAAFHGQETAYGFAAFWGLVLFGLVLYGNFSGGIDIIRGVSQCFDITLPDNFRQPFFSSSLGDFWRRWHITMGTWIKDYVFYPFSMSHAVSRLKKKAKKHLPGKWVNRITIACANIVAFLIVGIWHGSGGNYALWGLYNGLILAFSELMTDVYKKGKTLCHVKEESVSWRLFGILRTFLIVTIGWCTDCASTFAGSIAIILNMFRFDKTNLEVLQYSSSGSVLLMLLIVGILMAVEILHEKNISIRERINRWPVACQMIFWVIFIQIIALMGGNKSGVGFFYAYY